MQNPLTSKTLFVTGVKSILLIEARIRIVLTYRSLKKMTRIEKAVKLVSDLYDFYRQIPKIPKQDPVREEKHDEAPPSEQKGDPMNPEQL